MTKRFTYYEEDLGDMLLPKCLDNGKTVAKSVYECVDLLNQLSEENERLKKERNHFERKKTEYLTEWNTCRIQNTELKKDNQELKEAMKRMMIEMMGGKMND